MNYGISSSNAFALYARRGFFIILLVLAALFLPSSHAQSCVSAPNGLISIWSAEGSTVDSISSVQAAVVGTIGYGPGKVGQAFSFSGTYGSGIILSNPVSLQLQNFTIEAWVQLSSPAAASDRFILGYGSGGYSFGIHTNGVMYLSRVTDDILLSTNRITDTAWHHVAITKNGSSVVFYLDGNAEPAATYNSIFTFATPIAIGAEGDYLDFNFNGGIDELSIYGRALSAAEIRSIFIAGSAGKCVALPLVIVIPPQNSAVKLGGTVTLSVTAAGPGPIAYQWQFNGNNINGATTTSLTLTNAQLTAAGNYSVIASNTGATTNSAPATLVVVDGCTPIPAGLVGWWQGGSNGAEIVNAYDGQLLGGVGSASGEVGPAFNFTGTAGQAVLVTNSLPFELQEFTVEAWVRLNSPTSTVDRVIFGFGPESYAFLVRSTGTIAMSKVNEYEVESGAAITDTLWHHVAVVRQAYAGVTLYIDGVAYPTPGIYLYFNYYYQQALGIGAMGTGLGNSFSGQIDEVSFYNRMLGPDEIQAIYYAGTNGKCDTILPFVVTQPAGQTVLPGGTASFSVVGGGPRPLTYQWSFNNTIISGATNSTLTISNAQAANVGNYFVTVGNFNGSTNSSTATLSVNLPGCTPVPSGLVSWWQGEGNVLDAMGIVNGQIIGTNAYAAGETGNAFSFNGNYGSSINLGNPVALQLETFTIEGWIQLASPTSTANRLIIGYGAGGYAFGVQSNGNLFLAKVGVTNIASSYIVTDTAFHHVAVVRTATALTFYVDGVAYPSPVVPDAFYFNTPASIGALETVTVFLPPEAYTQTNYTSIFNGKIDELSVYNRALSTQEIQNIYIAGNSGKCQAILPQIVIQPLSTTVLMGGNAAFSVMAGPGPLTYQWQCNGSNISGATASALNITNAQSTNAGNYSVTVGNSNGFTNSALAALNVVASSCTPAPPGLVSLWPGEGNYLDPVGGNNGVIAGSAIAYLPGEVGQAFAFYGGSGAGINIGNPASLQTQNFTIETWIQLNTPTSSGAVFGYGNNGYLFGVATSGNLYLGVPYDDTPFETFTNVITSRCILSDTSFHHVAVTKSGATVVFYVDGVPYPGPVLTNTLVFNSLIAIGARGGNYAEDFNGKIDELSFYNRALATSEIQAIYVAGSNGKCVAIAPIITTTPAVRTAAVGGGAVFSVSAYGAMPFAYQWNFNGRPISGMTNSSLALTNVHLSDAGTYSVTVTNMYGGVTSSNLTLTVNPDGQAIPPFGLVGWWQAEGNAIDLVNTNNGTLNGGVTYATGEVGQAFKFDGTSGTISLTNTTALQLQNFTIEAWIQLASVTATGDRSIFGYGSSGYTFIVRTTGALGLSKVGTDIVLSPFTIADTSFHHVAVTKNGTAVVFYLDGVAYPAAVYSTSYSFSTSPAIGATGTSGVFNGKLDEVSVYNRALNASEIQSIYTAGATGKSVVALTNPTLNILQTNGNVLLTWPISPTGFNLENTAAMGVSNWTGVALTPVTNPTSGTITVTLPPSGTRQYYRLHHP